MTTRSFQMAGALLAMAMALLFRIDPLAAQACTSDFQCSPSAGGYNICLGDTLIQRRRICVGGQCQEQEMGRLNCGGGSAGGTCQGNVYVSGGNRCDALSGRCAQGSTIRIACTPSCTCTGRTLTIATGTCSAAGCVRTVLRCKVGCTCSPEPRCTEDPQPARRGAVQQAPGTAAAVAAAAAARASRSAASTLPPRIAEPFDAARPRVIVKQRTINKPRKTRKVKRRLRRL